VIKELGFVRSKLNIEFLIGRDRTTKNMREVFKANWEEREESALEKEKTS
jgi:hypothetical protein